MSSAASSRLSSELTQLVPSIQHDGIVVETVLAAGSRSGKSTREASSSAPSTSRHLRQPTPCDPDFTHYHVSTGLLDVTQNASGAVCTTTGAEESSTSRDSAAVNEEVIAASDHGGDGGKSVLFSDQHLLVEEDARTFREDSMGRDTALKGSRSIPRDKGDGAALDGDVEAEDVGVENADDMLEESQDDNDFELHTTGTRPVRAGTPTWLEEEEDQPLAGPSTRAPQGYMTRIVESKNRSAGLRSSQNKTVPHEAGERSTMRSNEVDTVLGNEEEDEEEEDDDDYLEEDVVPPDPTDYHSGDTAEFEMDHRPVLERTAIKAACHWLHSQMWTNWDEEEGSVLYKAVDRLGEGTFSSVFLARDLFHTKYDNEYWTGNKAQQVYTEYFGEDPTIRVALKKILVTSSPVRIENELSILESLRGSRNVSKLITAFRQDDQVIIVMSYHPCDDFRHFYRHMDVKHIRSYMRSLLRGLKEIHQRGIIHRDIKPANFLYDYATGQGAICDFGLAERYKPARRPTCQHSSASIRSSTSGKVRTAETPAVERAVYQARKRAKLGDGRVGFLGDDTRPSMKTNRAGTRGFRAPEVLLKCPDQSFAIDTWSAGIILLSILAQKFPIFNSTDDVEAMMEIAALFGRSALERCAMLHNRTLICNVPTLDADPQRTLKSIVLRLNPHLYTPPSSCPSSWEAEEHIRFIDHALRLLHGLLRLDCTSRFSASEALQHEFFSEEGEDMDQDFDDFEPVGIQDGKCGNLHGFVDGRHKAYFGNKLVEMHFGQGRTSSTETLCPEHEHWQMRTGLNALTSCTQFVRDEQEPAETDHEGSVDEEVVKRLPFAERDGNLGVEATGVEPKGKRRRED